MIYVFIAGPYDDSLPASEREANAHRAMKVWHELQQAGFVPYCPHLSHYLHSVKPEERTTWLAHARAWLPKCDCMFRLPGKSPGSDLEEEVMRAAGKPVFASIDAIRKAYFGE